MLAASQTDPECCPNTITYSSLITACERGGRLDRALDWYQQMQRNGVDADYIIYRCRHFFFFFSVLFFLETTFENGIRRCARCCFAACKAIYAGVSGTCCPAFAG
jgi:pentatricopeptide repeat protein